MAPVRVDQHDLQGNILAGYSFPHALFVVLRVTDPAAGREWVGSMLERGITSAVSFGGEKPASTLNLAFTHDGLRALGVPDEALRSFPDEYRAGMAARAGLLGDHGPDAPARWETGLRPGEPHVLVTLSAHEPEPLAVARDELERPGLHVVHQQSAAVIADPETGMVAREHFGFADGLAQPSIDGVAAHNGRPVGPTDRLGQGTPTGRGRWKALAPGEFVLGYPDEAGLVEGRPVDPLRRSGSYLVLRKLRQNVALFTRYLRNAADGDEDEARLLAAKIMGRWPDGTPIVKSPEPPEGATGGAPDNDFRYAADPHGLRCPLGAHIRRANPRDDLGFGGRLTARHRLIRRGMPYGPPPVDPAVEDGLERGLMFVCYQASIQRQFEVVQGRWLADGDAFGLGEDKDFLLGGEDPNGKMVIHGARPRLLSPRRSFVVNRGGGYFFAPGIEALRALARGL
jgi:Dyp-type peroxidase family